MGFYLSLNLSSLNTSGWTSLPTIKSHDHLIIEKPIVCVWKLTGTQTKWKTEESCVSQRGRTLSELQSGAKHKPLWKIWPAIITHILKWTGCMHSHMWNTCIQPRDWLHNLTFVFLKTSHQKPLQVYLSTYSLLYVHKGLYFANCTLEMTPFLLI